VAGLFVATGHYRNGILLAPITATVMADCIVDGQTPDSITPFLLQRFSRLSRRPDEPRRGRRGLTATRPSSHSSGAK
jgi:glycine/D-amino acid oxidase-like deaminating enzyme